MAKLRAFTMPKWGIEMSEGTIAEWMVEPGTPFSKGELLTLIETDKIANEVEAESAGHIARIIVSAGETVPVGTLLAVLSDGPAELAEIDGFVAGFAPADTTMAAGGGMAPDPRRLASPVAAGATAAIPPPIPENIAISPAARRHALDNAIAIDGIAGRGRDGRITLQDVILSQRPPNFIPAPGAVDVTARGEALASVNASPLAKRLAVLHGVDIAGLIGTGPRGRISKADVLSKVKAAETSQMEAPVYASDDANGPFETIAMSSMRKAIARQLSHSKQTIPHFYLRFTVQLDAIAHLRQLARQATGSAPSVNDYLVRATALALAEHPDINIQFGNEEIRRFAHANISIAVETPKGLVTPVVRHAETKSVAQISAEIRQLADLARAGKLQAGDMRGGSFSISNLGMFGVESFDAIINPPQGAILAVGAGIRKPMDANHAIAFATVASLSLSFDHRAIDGAAGARFGQTLKALIEDPARLIS